MGSTTNAADAAPTASGTRKPQTRRLDLLLAGMGSSGTTMLAHMLTDPEGGRVCLDEPRLGTRRPYGGTYRSYLEAVGLPACVRPRDLRAALVDLDRIGVKEIRAKHIRAALRRRRPERIVVMIRDARAALLSYHRKHLKRFGDPPRKSFPARLFLRTAPLLLRLCDETPSERLRVVRYEAFVSDESERAALSAWLDWPLTGDPSALFGVYGRDREAAHGRDAAGGSVARAEQAPPPGARQALEPVLRRLGPFQERFGYPTAFGD